MTDECNCNNFLAARAAFLLDMAESINPTTKAQYLAGDFGKTTFTPVSLGFGSGKFALAI